MSDDVKNFFVINGNDDRPLDLSLKVDLGALDNPNADLITFAAGGFVDINLPGGEGTPYTLELRGVGILSVGADGEAPGLQGAFMAAIAEVRGDRIRAHNPSLT